MNHSDNRSEFDEPDEPLDDLDADTFDDVESYAAGELTAEEKFPLGDEFSADDLEDAYRRALEVLEEADQTACQSSNAAEDALPNGSSSGIDSDNVAVEAVADGAIAQDVDDERRENSVSRTVTDRPTARTSSDALPTPSYESDVPELTPGSPLTPRHIIEAALFVGGAPLTTKKLSSLFKGSYDGEYIEEQIDDLNRHYLEQNRPYEIRLVEGGHRLMLRPEYERIRHRVFGFGPREVRLSQDALEVLALIAYQQPIHRKTLEECDKKNLSNLVNQLVRRELVEVARGKNSKDLTYRTTPRFLALFGIGSLEELPVPDDLSFK